MPTSPEYFIGLRNTSSIRRGLLESAKQSVLLLKAQYGLRETRAKKKELIEQLTHHIAEIEVLTSGLDEDLPAHSRDDMPEAVRRAAQRLEEKEQLSERPASVVTKKPDPIVEKPKPVKQVDTVDQEIRDLEKQLSAIESKLNKL